MSKKFHLFLHTVGKKCSCIFIRWMAAINYFDTSRFENTNEEEKADATQTNVGV